MIDINGLKIINDAYGHKQGDLSIKLVSNLLMQVFRTDDVVARIGGDEFVVLSEEIDQEIISSKAYSLESLIKTYNASTPVKMNISNGSITVINNELSFDKAFVEAAL